MIDAFEGLQFQRNMFMTSINTRTLENLRVAMASMNQSKRNRNKDRKISQNSETFRRKLKKNWKLFLFLSKGFSETET